MDGRRPVYQMDRVGPLGRAHLAPRGLPRYLQRRSSLSPSSSQRAKNRPIRCVALLLFCPDWCVMERAAHDPRSQRIPGEQHWEPTIMGALLVRRPRIQKKFSMGRPGGDQPGVCRLFAITRPFSNRGTQGLCQFYKGRRYVAAGRARGARPEIRGASSRCSPVSYRFFGESAFCGYLCRS
jgi:hypothetical protein